MMLHCHLRYFDAFLLACISLNLVYKKNFKKIKNEFQNWILIRGKKRTKVKEKFMLIFRNEWIILCGKYCIWWSYLPWISLRRIIIAWLCNKYEQLFSDILWFLYTFYYIVLLPSNTTGFIYSLYHYYNEYLSLPFFQMAY